jgi:hypothetical protein
LRRGGVRPGRSSADGGIDELPLLRDASRSSRSTLAARSATCPASRAFSVASATITRACAAITASRAASSGIRRTNHHDHGILAVIKLTRQAARDFLTALALAGEHVRHAMRGSCRDAQQGAGSGGRAVAL